MIDNTEREKYNKALQRASVAKGFDRIILIAIFIILLALSIGVYVQTVQYQSEMRANSAARDKQLDQLLKNQAVSEKQTESIKAYLRCVALIPTEQRTDESLNKCASENKLPTIQRKNDTTSSLSNDASSQSETAQINGGQSSQSQQQTTGSTNDTSNQSSKSPIQNLTDGISNFVINLF